jgi:predicted double-glycine peptidase
VKIPLVKQVTDYSCAAAAFEAAAKSIGINCNQPELMLIMGCKPELGTSSSGVIAACDHFQIRYEYRTFMSLDDLKLNTDVGNPVIVSLQLWGDVEFPEMGCSSFNAGHYVTIAKVSDTHVYFMDPWLEKYLKLSIDEFMCRWHNEFGNRYTEQMAIVLESEVKSVDFVVSKSPLPEL